jgi:hypothetical protein
LASLPAADAFFIRPAAQGAATGLSWDDALALADLPRCLAALNAGGTIYVAAYDGAYAAAGPITISRPAAQGAATIRGAAANNSPAKAVINGTRAGFVGGTNYARTDPAHDGTDIFRIADGTAALTISHFSFADIGNGILFMGGADAITLTDMDANNSYMLIDAERDENGTTRTADLHTISSLTLARLTSTGYEMGLFNSIATMPNFSATDIAGDSQYNYGQAFTEGFHLAGTVADPVMTNVNCDNSAYNNRGGVYWNGDGICCEAGVSGATWTNCGGQGNDDGGMDTKDAGGTYNGCVVARNKKNFKHWGATGTHNDPISSNPVKNGGTDNPQHFLFAGNGDAEWTINRPVIRNDPGNTSPIFHNERTAGTVTLHVIDWDIVVDPDTVAVSGAFIMDCSPPFPTVDSFTLTWRSGCEQGVIDQGTSIGATIADLASAGSNATGDGLAYTVHADPDGKFQISGSELQLKAALDPSIKTSHSGTVCVYDPSGLVKQDIAFTIYVNATALDDDAQSWYDALGTAGLTQPQRRWRSAYDNFVREIKRINGGAFWTALDGLIPLYSYDVAVAARNLRQDGYHAAFTGTTDWAARRSWKGNGVDAKIDIAFNASTAGGGFQQDNNHLGIDVLASVDEAAIDFSVDASTRTFVRSLFSGVYGANDQGASSSTNAQASGVAHIAVSRYNNSATYQRFRDAASSNISKPSIALANANLAAGHNSSSGNYTTREYALLHWGGGFPNGNTDFQAFRIAWAQFKAQAAIAE